MLAEAEHEVKRCEDELNEYQRDSGKTINELPDNLYDSLPSKISVSLKIF